MRQSFLSVLKQPLNILGILSIIFIPLILLNYWSSISYIQIIVLLILFVGYIYFLIKSLYQPFMSIFTQKKQYSLRTYKIRYQKDEDQQYSSTNQQRQRSPYESVRKQKSLIKNLKQFMSQILIQRQRQQNINPDIRQFAYNSRYSAPRYYQYDQPFYTQEYDQYQQQNQSYYSRSNYSPSQGDIDNLHQCKIPDNNIQFFNILQQKLLSDDLVREFQNKFNIVCTDKEHEMSKILSKNKRDDSPFYMGKEWKYYESFVVSKQKNRNSNQYKILLTQKQNNIEIYEPSRCLSLLSLALRDYIRTFLRDIHNIISQINRTTILLYGLKVIYQQYPSKSSIFKNCTIYELHQTLKSILNNSHISSKFILKVSNQELNKKYLTRLLLQTQNIIEILKYDSNMNACALFVLMKILNIQLQSEQRRFQKQLISFVDSQKSMKNYSLASKKSHNQQYQVYYYSSSVSKQQEHFSINKIVGFKTQNPLLIVLAILCDMQKNDKNKKRVIIQEFIDFIKIK